MEHPTIRSCISYQGSKYELINTYRIQEFIPPTNTNRPYCEVFGGGLTMFFNIADCTCAFLNDIDSDLVNFWIQIQKYQTEFEAKLKYVWCGNGFLEELAKETSDISRAVAYYLRNRMGMYIKFPKPLEKDISFWKQKLDATRILIMNYDYATALDMVCRVRNPLVTEDYYMVIYEDPPYYHLQANYKTQSFDHQRLWQLNQQYTKQGQHILLSYNKCAEIETLYRDWYKLEFPMRQMHPEMEKRVELLLSNRPLERHSKKAIPKKLTDFVKVSK